MQPLEDAPFRPLPTLDMESLSFTVSVASTTLGTFTLPTPRVTTYRDWKGPEKSKVNEGVRGQAEKFGDYVFAEHEATGGGYHLFHFVRVRPPALEFSPLASESYSTSAPHPWPDVLLALNFAENPYEPITIEKDGGVLQLNRVHELQKFLPGDVMATDFDVEIFVSHRPFQASFRRLDVPVPTQIGPYRVRNVAGTMPRCLHGRVLIPEVPSGIVMDGYGTIDDEQIDPTLPVEYPATNHRRWKRHVSYRHQQKQGVLWILEVRWANPPRGVKAVTNTNA